MENFVSTDGSAALNLAGVRREEVDSVVVRFAGDSGDGIQLTGGRFAETTAIAGQDLETFPIHDESSLSKSLFGEQKWLILQ